MDFSASNQSYTRQFQQSSAIAIASTTVAHGNILHEYEWISEAQLNDLAAALLVGSALERGRGTG